MTLALHSK